MWRRKSNRKRSGVVKANEKWGELFIELMSNISLTELNNTCQCPFRQVKKSRFSMIGYITRSFYCNRSAAELWVHKGNKFWLPNTVHVAFTFESKGRGSSACKINTLHYTMEGLWRCWMIQKQTGLLFFSSFSLLPIINSKLSLCILYFSHETQTTCWDHPKMTELYQSLGKDMAMFLPG